MRSIGPAVAMLVLTAFDVAAEGVKLPCYCRYAGRQFEMGAVACIPTHEGPRFARCDMQLNVPSWTFLTTPCALSGTVPPRDSGGLTWPSGRDGRPLAPRLVSGLSSSALSQRVAPLSSSSRALCHHCPVEFFWVIPAKRCKRASREP